VLNLLNGGAGSLRQAILDGNASPDISNDIQFPNPGVTGTISLTTALPAITKNVNIFGPGSGNLTVERDTAEGTPFFRIFTIGAGVTVSIQGMTIRKGLPAAGLNGGGIQNDGNLVMSDVKAFECYSTANGGAIANYGTLSMWFSTLSNNTAEREGGGVYN